MKELEEGNKLTLDWSKLDRIGQTDQHVIPVAVQDCATHEVILIAYVNEAALRASIDTKIATFWSTSRNELWVKGATSGETFAITDIFVNCEQNSLVFQVKPNRGGICHTKNRAGQPRNCYYRKLNFTAGAATDELVNINP